MEKHTKLNKGKMGVFFRCPDEEIMNQGFYLGNVPFKAGVCITVEPGLYFAADDSYIPEQYRGIGIRIEDTCLITENGCEVLSKAAPKEIQDIEDVMHKMPKRQAQNNLLDHDVVKRSRGATITSADEKECEKKLIPTKFPLHSL